MDKIDAVVRDWGKYSYSVETVVETTGKVMRKHPGQRVNLKAAICSIETAITRLESAYATAKQLADYEQSFCCGYCSTGYVSRFAAKAIDITAGVGGIGIGIYEANKSEEEVATSNVGIGLMVLASASARVKDWLVRKEEERLARLFELWKVLGAKQTIDNAKSVLKVLKAYKREQRGSGSRRRAVADSSGSESNLSDTGRHMHGIAQVPSAFEDQLNPAMLMENVRRARKVRDAVGHLDGAGPAATRIKKVLGRTERVASLMTARSANDIDAGGTGLHREAAATVVRSHERDVVRSRSIMIEVPDDPVVAPRKRGVFSCCYKPPVEADVHGMEMIDRGGSEAETSSDSGDSVERDVHGMEMIDRGGSETETSSDSGDSVVRMEEGRHKRGGK